MIHVLTTKITIRRYLTEVHVHPLIHLHCMHIDSFAYSDRNLPLSTKMYGRHILEDYALCTAVGNLQGFIIKVIFGLKKK